LFDVIAHSYLSAMMPNFRYRQTTVTLDVRGHQFAATGRQPIECGWRAAFPDWQPAGEKGDDAQLLPSLRNGETARLRDALVEDKETRPPSRYNEGTLIEAMQNAWRFVADPVLQEWLKEAKGIGTPATHAEIIRGLKAQDFLIADGKHIVPTERGLSLFAVLERADPALVDPGVTAQMECLLDEVLIGQQAMVGAIDAVCAQASRIIGRLQESATIVGAPLLGMAKARSADQPPTPAMKRLVDRSAKQKAPRHRAAIPPRARARTMDAWRLAPDRGNGVVRPAPIDVRQSERPDEPNRKAKNRRGSKPGYTRSRVGAAKADDATLTFSGGCEHGPGRWRGGEAFAK
jgi:DNA topoisomerase-3